MSIANKALAVLAALAFLLPFVSFSCSSPYGKYSVDVTGAKLVKCAINPCTARDIFGEKPGPFQKNIPDIGIPDSGGMQSTVKRDLGLNFVMFAAIAVVVAAIALFFGKRPVELVSGLASVGAIVLLFVFRSKFGDAFAPGLNSPEMQAAGALVKVELQFALGFWACAVLSGLSAILAFKGTAPSRSPAPAGAAGSSGGFAPHSSAGAPSGTSEQLAVCSACGSVNTAGNKFCLSCGNVMAAPPPPIESKAAAPPPGAACPSCGASNPPTSKFCLSCGASLIAPIAPSAPIETKAPAPPLGAVCPSCGASNPASIKFCLSCGTSMTAAAAPPAPVETKPAAPLPGMCPSCGASNPPTSKFCLSCGASLMANVQIFDRSESATPPPPAAPVAAQAAPPEPQPGDDMSWINAPASMSMAAAASVAAPVGHTLPLTAPDSHRAAPEAPPAAPPPPPAPAPPQMSQPELNWQVDSPAEQAHPDTKQVVEEELPVPPPPAQQPSCAACGAAMSPEQKFCLACGTPAGQAAAKTEAPSAPPPPAQQPSCAACGAAMSPGQKFCLACGTPVGQAPAKTEAPPPPAEATHPAPAETFQPSAEVQIFEPAPKSSSKAWILVILVLAILGAGGWFGWQYFSRPDVTVIAIPQRIHVAIGGRTTLGASVSGSKDTDVDWSIQEGSKGGQIAALGSTMTAGQVRAAATYTAPTTAGTFHVIAASHANPGRSAKIEVVVGASEPENPIGISQPTPAPAPTTPGATNPAATNPAATNPASTYPNAAQIVGTWRGPSTDMTTTIGADSSIAVASATNPQKNLSGTYRFTDNTHLNVDFGNGDVRKWEIVSVDSTYLRVTAQSKEGSSAIIFQKIQ